MSSNRIQKEKELVTMTLNRIEPIRPGQMVTADDARGLARKTCDREGSLSSRHARIAVTTMGGTMLLLAFARLSLITRDHPHMRCGGQE